MTEHKLYIGDGVYVDTDGYHIVLTTENGIEVTNTIYLEPEVLALLNDWVERLKGESRDANKITEDGTEEGNKGRSAVQGDRT